MLHFRTDDIVKTLQAFHMIKYFGGQHSIYVSPKTLDTYYTSAKPNCAPPLGPFRSSPVSVPTPRSRARAGIIDGAKVQWTPYDQRDLR